MTDKLPRSARDRQIAAIAARQHGLITSRQLADVGLSRQGTSDRVKAGRLHRVRRGVYAVGHTVLSANGHRHAAVLAIGDLALTSHTTAAAIWEIRPTTSGLMHVTTTTDARDRASIRVHRRPIHPDDRARRDGIPVTSLALTLVDLGDVDAAHHLRKAFVRAEQLRLIDMTAIDAALDRASDRRRGPTLLRELLRGYDPRWQQTRSDLELAMLDLVTRHALPEPEVNAWIHERFMVDFLWRDERLIVETDGAQTHSTPTAQRGDARRDHVLTSLRYRVLRLPSVQLRERPRRAAADIVDALSRSRQR